jgi:hypothetical protein
MKLGDLLIERGDVRLINKHYTMFFYNEKLYDKYKHDTHSANFFVHRM